VAEFLLATYDHAAIAYWIAKCGGKTSPSGFIRAQLQKNAPRPALVAESGKKGGQAGSAPDREDWKEERQRVQVADYEQTQAYLRDLRENGTKEWKPEEGSGFARMKEAMKGDRSTRAVMDQIEAQAAALKLGEGR
jgi:hypothetical protein